MSRTLKDKPSKLKHEPYWQDRYLVPIEDDEFFRRYMYAKTTKAKKRKEVDTEEHWMSTPGWWVNLMMNRPQRREVRVWERKALFSDLDDLIQPVKKYKHVYYW
jgi:hypothetical protein